MHNFVSNEASGKKLSLGKIETSSYNINFGTEMPIKMHTVKSSYQKKFAAKKIWFRTK